jgi:hypothetical protein
MLAPVAAREAGEPPELLVAGAQPRAPAGRADEDGQQVPQEDVLCGDVGPGEDGRAHEGSQDREKLDHRGHDRRHRRSSAAGSTSQPRQASLRLRDTIQGGPAQMSAQRYLSDLPATWTPGASYPNAPLSVYVVAVAPLT